MQPTVTGSFDIRERIERTVEYFRSLTAQNEVLAASSKPITAHTWQRDPLCPDGHPMKKNLTPNIYYQIGEFYCPTCHQARIDAQVEQAYQEKVRTCYRPGIFIRTIHSQWADEIRETERQKIFAELATMKKNPTGQLPARDIVLASTPPKVVIPNPTTPTPETPAVSREDLFADVPEKAVISAEDAEEITERRRAVVITEEVQARTTVQIPAMEVEVLLLETMRHIPTSEQTTGENERVAERHWML